jgi:hypothetical protein
MGEQQHAGSAGAEDVPVLEIRDVTVHLADRLGAHLAPLDGRPGGRWGRLGGRPLTLVLVPSRGEPAQAHVRSLLSSALP